MAFDLDSFSFHFGEYQKEIAEMKKQLTESQLHALVQTCAQFIVQNRYSFMNSKQAAWECFKLFQGVVNGEFPGTSTSAITSDSSANGCTVVGDEARKEAHHESTRHGGDP